MSENHFKILEVGKNVRKFIFRRNRKMSVNEFVKMKNVSKATKISKMSEN